MGLCCIFVLLNGCCFLGLLILGGVLVNLNVIFMVVVECIDIMIEGVLFIYGFDVMVGVVNVVLKDNYEGLSFNVGVGYCD